MQAGRGLLVHSLPHDVISIRKTWKLKLWQLVLTHGNANIYLLITCWENARHHCSQHEDTCLHSFYIHSITFLATLPYLSFQHPPYIPPVKCTTHLFKQNWAAQLHFPYCSWTKPKSYLNLLFWKVSFSSHPITGAAFLFLFIRSLTVGLELVFPPARQKHSVTLSLWNLETAQRKAYMQDSLFAIHYSIDNFSIVLKP